MKSQSITRSYGQVIMVSKFDSACVAFDELLNMSQNNSKSVKAGTIAYIIYNIISFMLTVPQSKID